MFGIGTAIKEASNIAMQGALMRASDALDDYKRIVKMQKDYIAEIAGSNEFHRKYAEMKLADAILWKSAFHAARDVFKKKLNINIKDTPEYKVLHQRYMDLFSKRMLDAINKDIIEERVYYGYEDYAARKPKLIDKEKIMQMVIERYKTTEYPPIDATEPATSSMPGSRSGGMRR